MKQTLVTIVAMSVDKDKAILYLQDGSIHTLSQGDPVIHRVLEQGRDALLRNEPVEVDITPIYAKRQEMLDAEQGTGGVIKFFRIAKNLLSKLINTESPDSVPEHAAHVSPLDIGQLPWKAPVEVTGDLEPVVEEVAYKTVILKANPVNRVGAIKAIRTYSSVGLKEASDIIDAPRPTIVGIKLSQEDADNLVIGLTVFPDADNVEIVDWDSSHVFYQESNESKIKRANDKMDALAQVAVGTDDPSFHRKLREDETIVAVHTGTGAIIPEAQKLGHQLKAASKLQDFKGFTRFIERLSIIIDERGHSVEDLMKFIEHGDLPIADDGCIVIYKRLVKKGDTFVDVHSGNIKQNVGSYVFLRPGLVDPNRRKDCSNGLHVASLSYLGSFSGNVTVVAKVRPEDVFAVPEYNTNKMRVCGYHILAELPENLRTLVNSGGSISSVPAGAELLNKILAGDHTPITELVEVGGNRGSNVTYTPVAQPVAGEVSKVVTDKPTLDLEESLEPEVPVAAPVAVADLKPEIKPVKETKAQIAQRLYADFKAAATQIAMADTAVALVNLKRDSKKSWEALGLPGNAGDVIIQAAQKAPSATEVKTITGFDDVKVKEPKAGSPKARIAKLFADNNSAINESVACEALAIKAKAKKSWAALGVSDEVADMIKALTK